MKHAVTLLALVLALAACSQAPAPAPVDDTPIVTDPVPVPDPAVAYAPVGECPVLVTLWPPEDAILDYKFDATLTLTLGNPCEDGAWVPFLFREQSKIPGRWDEYDLIVDGAFYEGQGFNIAVPFERRSDRFEVVDARDGTVVASVQNYRLRVPRPF